MKAIYYQGYDGKWHKDQQAKFVKELKERLQYVKKNLALNGRAGIFLIVESHGRVL